MHASMVISKLDGVMAQRVCLWLSIKWNPPNTLGPVISLVGPTILIVSYSQPITSFYGGVGRKRVWFTAFYLALRSGCNDK